MKKAVFCLADNKDHADRIVHRLQEMNFRNEDISVLMSDNENRVVRREPGLADENRTNRKGRLATENTTKAPEGAAAGATIGGIIGGSLGLLAGIGSLAIPGVGPFIAAGPIMAALSGSGIGGALGLLVGSLVGLGLPEYEAKKYEDALGKGHILICAHAANTEQVERAKDVFNKEGGKDISTSSEKTGSRYS